MSVKGETKENPISVTLLSAELKSAVERRFPRVFVSGEISGWKVYPSGHAYFTLKDDGAQISAVMFRSSLERCKSAAALKEGAKVLVYAGATFYPQRGNCQLVVYAAKMEGEGDLMRRYLELKAKFTGGGGSVGSNFKDRKAAKEGKRVLICPYCKEKLRVPVGAGNIKIRCPHCKREFEETV